MRALAHEQLSKRSATEVLPCLCQLLEDGVSTVAQRAVIDLSEHFSATVDLTPIRRDGWIEEAIGDGTNQQQAKTLLGIRTLAYSVMLGLEISALHPNRSVPAASVVQFSTPDGKQAQLPLSVFQTQVAAAVLESQVTAPTVPLLPADETVVDELLGEVLLLLAPLFGISLKRLVVNPAGDGFGSVLGFSTRRGYTYTTIDSFVILLRRLVHRDMVMAQNQPLALDLSQLEAADRADQQGDGATVLYLLEDWPAMLSSMLRTNAVTDLEDDQLAGIAKGVLLLGRAYLRRDQIQFAEEIFRLGIQYTQETAHCGLLFLRMGLLCNDRGRWAEAIGYLRRAWALGEDEAITLPALGLALLETKRPLGAFIVARLAVEHGHRSSLLRTILNRIEQIFGESKMPFGGSVPAL